MTQIIGNILNKEIFEILIKIALILYLLSNIKLKYIIPVTVDHYAYFVTKLFFILSTEDSANNSLI